MEVSFWKVLQRTQLMAPWQHPHTAFLFGCVVKVNYGRHHRVLFMRKIRIILVHGEWGASLRGFDEQLRVMKPHVRPDQVRYTIGKAWINNQSCKCPAVK